MCCIQAALACTLQVLHYLSCMQVTFARVTFGRRLLKGYFSFWLSNASLIVSWRCTVASLCRKHPHLLDCQSVVETNAPLSVGQTHFLFQLCLW